MSHICDVDCDCPCSECERQRAEAKGFFNAERPQVNVTVSDPWQQGESRQLAQRIEQLTDERALLWKEIADLKNELRFAQTDIEMREGCGSGCNCA